jgi:hypothetical protein
LKNNNEEMYYYNYYNNIKFICLQLKNDKEVVLAAVKQNVWIFKYTSNRLKNDKDVVLATVIKFFQQLLLVGCEF